MDETWVGIDAGKGFHWAHVMDACGAQLLSRRVENEEEDLLKLIEEALSLAGRGRLTIPPDDLTPARRRDRRARSWGREAQGG